MKKVIMLAAVVAALVSCQSKGTKAEEAVADSLAVAMEPTMEERYMKVCFLLLTVRASVTC